MFNKEGILEFLIASANKQTTGLNSLYDLELRVD